MSDPEPQSPSAPISPTESSPLATKPARLTPAQIAEAEALFLSGFSPTQIGEQLGANPRTISAHAVRRGWNAKRAAMRKSSTSLATRKTAQIIAEARANLVEGMSEIIGQGVEALRKQPPRGRNQVRAHFAAAQAIVEVAKPVLGIGEANGGKTPPINLTFLSAPGQFMRPVEVPAEIVSEQAQDQQDAA